MFFYGLRAEEVSFNQRVSNFREFHRHQARQCFPNHAQERLSNTEVHGGKQYQL